MSREGEPSRLRAGILVTGTEILTGVVTDRNGPWLARELQALGVRVAEILLVGDRPADIARGLQRMRDEGLDVVVTSGGLGPTADDLTVEAVAEQLGLPLFLDEELQARIAAIVRPLAQRRGVDAEALTAGNRKQATVPRGACVLDPVGTAPGLVIADGRDRDRGAPVIVVLPGPPRELQPMWRRAAETEPLRSVLSRARRAKVHTLRLFGIPESQLAQTLREAQRDGVDLDELEVTTRVPDGAAPAYEALAAVLAAAHPRELFSRDGATVDEQVAGLMSGRSIAVAESCTGGMLAARLTDLPGSSVYTKGGLVVYSNEAKVALAGVRPETLKEHGAVSEQVAAELAEGARRALQADVGVGVTGIAGPGGGSPEKPVGTVWLGIAGPGERSITRCVRLPGGREEVRERAVTVAMHMIRRALLPAG